MQLHSENSAPSSAITLTILILILVHSNGGAISIPKNETFPAVFVFGDSIVDTGNNNNLNTIGKSNFPPYGRDFKGGVPTGRFSNGKVASDFIAEGFGVKEFLPAYLDPNLKIEDLLTGVSFASGANGYDPLTSQLASVLSLSDQLEMFKSYMKTIEAAVGEDRARTIQSKSIYVLCTGSNDFTNTYFLLPFRRSHYDVNGYADLLVEFASSFLQELYGLGARRIGVLSLPPMGCLPSQRTLEGGIPRECSENLNQAANIFNSKLSSKLDSLNKIYPEAILVYIDIYSPLLDLIQNPFQHGFEVADKGCCGTGNIEVSIICTIYSPHTCIDASKYIFWDSFHPSEKAYKVLCTEALNKISKAFF